MYEPKGWVLGCPCVPAGPRAPTCLAMETEGGGHPMPLSGLTEGSKSTLVMLPPAPSRVWLASRRPGGTRGRDRYNEVTNLMKMRSWNQEWENQSFLS